MGNTPPSAPGCLPLTSTDTVGSSILPPLLLLDDVDVDVGLDGPVDCVLLLHLSPVPRSAAGRTSPSWLSRRWCCRCLVQKR